MRPRAPISSQRPRAAVAVRRLNLHDEAGAELRQRAEDFARQRLRERLFGACIEQGGGCCEIESGSRLREFGRQLLFNTKEPLGKSRGQQADQHDGETRHQCGRDGREALHPATLIAERLG